MLAACGPGPESARDDVLAFYHAAHYGDVPGQMKALVPEAERTEYGALVMEAMFLPHLMVRFVPDSAVLAEVRGDTALWIVLGTEPDYRASGYSAAVDTLPRERTRAEMDAAPRMRAQQGLELVRGEDGWKLRLDAARLGPVLAKLDTIRKQCPFHVDPRPCRAPAERLRRAAQGLPPVHARRAGYLVEDAERVIRAAQAMDSLRVELVGEVEDDPGGLYSYFDVAVLNRSGTPLRYVRFRVVDAEGSVVDENGSVTDVPARGRVETRVQVRGRSFPRPVRLEAFFADLP